MIETMRALNITGLDLMLAWMCGVVLLSMLADVPRILRGEE